MPTYSHSKKITALKKQHGMATLLLVILMGMGLAATALSVMYSVRGVQEKQLSNHAVTNAQQLAWIGVEAVRQYLNTFDSADKLSAFDESFASANENEPTELTLTGTENILAEILDIQSGSTYKVTVNIKAVVAEGTPAESRSTIQVVYEIDPNANGGSGSGSGGGTGGGGGGGSGGSGAAVNAINIYKDLTLTGSIQVSGASNAVFNVDGNVTMSGSVTGIKTINATGNVSISSGINVGSINANGNVTLSGSASVTTSIVTMGSVTLSGAATVNSIKANGDVTLSGGSATVSTTLESRGNVIVSGGSAKAATVSALGYVNWTSSANATSISSNSYVNYAGSAGPTTINANGNATLTGGGATTVTANGNVSITYGTISNVYATGSLSATNGNVSAGKIGGSKSCPGWNPCTGVTVQAGYVATPSTVSITPVTSIVVSRPSVDVYLQKTAANYVFEIDSSGYRKVTVQAVAGIPNGTYFLGEYSSNSDGYKDYLCTAVSGSASAPTCTAPVNTNTPYSAGQPSYKPKTICRGFSNYNSCVSYSSGTWTVNGSGFAPGVLWFKGNLAVTNGVYYNTMMATGNISTGGSLKVYAVNYAGLYPVCKNANDTNSSSSTYNIYPSPYARFDGLYPTAFCSGSGSSAAFIDPAPALGNLAFMAGGYEGSTYVGGDITLGASNQIYGSLLAGNTLTTGGSTYVHGYISIAALRSSSANWGGSTTIDLNNLPGTYDPGDTPCEPNCPQDDENDDDNGNGQPVVFARIRWTRYL